MKTKEKWRIGLKIVEDRWKIFSIWIKNVFDEENLFEEWCIVIHGLY